MNRTFSVVVVVVFVVVVVVVAAISCWILATAASPLAALRAATMTVAPWRASYSAV